MSAELRGQPCIHVAVDVGGTFTDVVAVVDGRLEATKVPSTYPDPSAGVIAGVMDLLERLGLPASSIASLSHATTAATNALLERRGARVGLVVTDGYGDVLEIARLRRADPFDLTAGKLIPLVPRSSVLEIAERVTADGEVLVPLDREAVTEAAEKLAGLDIEAVAVCFLHSYRYPGHERDAADMLRSLLPGIPVFASHEVLPQAREYERASTTAIAAFLGPLMSSYLRRLRDRLTELGGPAKYWVMKSSGGLVSAEHAAHHPEELVESGPAAGVIGVAAVGRSLGEPDLIAFDMGGTTAKAAVIEGGRHGVDHDYEVGGPAHAGGLLNKGTGYPLRVPVVDLAEVGTGGGSIAWVDEADALRVGPRSAGSVPGPVAYGRGGIEPTVTDAYLALGVLAAQPEGHLGELDHASVEIAMQGLATRLGVTPAELARGIFALATAQMSDAVRMVTVARGRDPRDFVFVPSGGAGPVHAWAIAEDLGVRRILVPPLAGVHSAVGLITADIEVSRSAGLGFTTSDPDVAARVGHVLDGLLDEAIKELAEQVPDTESHAEPRISYSADLRYRGQSYELGVPLQHQPGAALDLSAARDRFDQAHQTAYGHHRRDAQVEIVTVRVVASVPRPTGVASATATTAADVERRDRLVDFGDGPITCGVLPRRAVGADEMSGPLVVEQPDTTVVVPPGWHVRRIIDGSLELRKADSK